MKNFFQFLVLFFAINSFSQSVNDYKAVIVPLRFEFMKTDNQYRLATISKFNLTKAGFIAFYSNESISSEYNNRCSLLYFDVVKEKAFLATKLHVFLNDCNGKSIFISESAYTKEKDTQLAYTEVLNKAFESIYSLQYKYNGGMSLDRITSQSETRTMPSATVITPVVSAVVPVVAVPVAAIIPTKVVEKKVVEAKIQEVQIPNLLYAQATATGFQLIDSTPKVVMKLLKTSQENSFIAIKGTIQGSLILKDNQWYFEYYQNDKFISEKIDVKF